MSSSNLYHDDKALIAKLQKKKNKIKKLKEAVLLLQKENESLKAKDTIPIQSNDDVELMKVQLNQYEMKLEENNNQYLYQISLLKNDNDNYQKRLCETEEYISIINAFFRNIMGLVGGIRVNVFDITELTNQLNHIGDFLSKLIKENSSLKVKYHKLLEMNTKLVDYDIDNNNNHHQVFTGDCISTFQSLSHVDNVFELNKDKDKMNNEEMDNANSNMNDHLIKIKQYHANNRDSNSNNAQSPMITVDIYKTLEQRVNMLERELNMQKQSSIGNNSSNNYSFISNHNNNNNRSNTKTISIKTDHITNKRSKSSTKMDVNINNTNGNNNIPMIDKPIKKTHKKKKTKNESKISQSHKPSAIITTNNIRSVTPINSKKSSGITKIKLK